MNVGVWILLYILGISISYFVFRLIDRKLGTSPEFTTLMALGWPVSIAMIVIALPFFFMFEAIDCLVDKVSR